MNGFFKEDGTNENISKGYVDKGFELKTDKTEFNAYKADYTTRVNGTKQGESINTIGGLRLGQREAEPVIVFTSDDSTIEDYTRLKPLFEPKGVPVTMAVITNYIGDVGKTTVAQLLELQALGWEIASHQINTARLDTFTTLELDNALKDSKEVLLALGANHVNSLVYTGGVHNEAIRKATRKYYRCGVGVSKGLLNEDVLKTYALNRVALGSYFDVAAGYPATNTLEYYKIRVDEAIANKRLLIFMMHPNQAEHDEIQQGYISELIDYIQSLNVPTLTLDEALDRVGNLIDIGDNYDDTTEYFTVGASGQVRTNVLKSSSFNYKKISTLGIDNNTPLSSFPTDCVSTVALTANVALEFPEAGGTLVTYNISTSEYSFQMFYHYYSNRIYRRRWDYVSSVWKPWSQISSASLPINTITNVSGITAFEFGITVTCVDDAHATGFPDNLGGILTTYKQGGITNASSYGYSYQEYKKYNTWDKYIRYLDTAGVWSVWKQFSVI